MYCFYTIWQKFITILRKGLSVQIKESIEYICMQGTAENTVGKCSPPHNFIKNKFYILPKLHRLLWNKWNVTVFVLAYRKEVWVAFMSKPSQLKQINRPTQVHFAAEIVTTSALTHTLHFHVKNAAVSVPRKAFLQLLQWYHWTPKAEAVPT